MDNKEAKALLLKYGDGKCTAEEKALLESWFIKLKSEQLPYNLPEEELETDLHEVWKELEAERFSKKEVKFWPAFIPALRSSVAAAAAVLLVIGAGTYFYNSGWSVFNPDSQIRSKNDIAPGRNMATITLADGTAIPLNDHKTGIVIGNDLRYNDSSLVQHVQIGELSPGAKMQLMVSTPRGGEYKVVLPDGTQVWLNAASSLKFPSSFANKATRSVELNGEAYFEVAKDKKHPFIVQTKQQETIVLGTHFNINSYDDEPASKTTLLEGAIRISNASEKITQTLKPGEQAMLQLGAISVNTVDADLSIDWKNGEFSFKNEDLQSIMRKISRWYNVEIAYHDDKITRRKFSGTVSKFENVSKVLKILDLTGDVHFKIEGRKIIVMD